MRIGKSRTHVFVLSFNSLVKMNSIMASALFCALNDALSHTSRAISIFAGLSALGGSVGAFNERTKFCEDCMYAIFARCRLFKDQVLPRIRISPRMRLALDGRLDEGGKRGGGELAGRVKSKSA